jgi:hypothetical protein
MRTREPKGEKNNMPFFGNIVANQELDELYIPQTDAPSGALLGDTDTQTLQGKRIKPRVSAQTSPSTITPDVSATDLHIVGALANASTINNPAGSPSGGEELFIRLKDNGTPQTLTWGNGYRSATSLPGTTTASKTHYFWCKYNATDTKFDVLLQLAF